jgi:transcriptional antiterminator RfaH
MTLSPKDNPLPVHPAELLIQDTRPDPTRPWWVARTRTRQEKALARSLRGKDIPYFLPMVSRPQKSQGRMRTSIVPLFDGYLFFQANAADRQTALQTGHLAQAIPVKSQDVLHGQLQAIARVCEQNISLELVDFAQPGKKVRIIAGPFAGLAGHVRTVKSAKKLVLNVDAIGQAVAVEIALDHIQPE